MTNPLSKREQEVVDLLLQGKSNKMIAAALGISERTVEFHLRNIYAKYRVSSRMELVLKRGKATGEGETGELVESTVDKSVKRADNKDTVSIHGKESELKDLMKSKQAAMGVITALFTGLVWVLLMRRFGHMSLNDIAAWILPAGIVWAAIGISVGVYGKRNGATPFNVIVGSGLGTGSSPFAILPLMGFVVLPVGKLADGIGLIDRSTISIGIATTLAILAMLAIWLIVGTAIGIMWLSLTARRAKREIAHSPVS